jgi:flagellum-specific peptidoglycan hydrolase FlgJ
MSKKYTNAEFDMTEEPEESHVTEEMNKRLFEKLRELHKSRETDPTKSDATTFAKPQRRIPKATRKNKETSMLNEVHTQIAREAVESVMNDTFFSTLEAFTERMEAAAQRMERACANGAKITPN